jgi:CDP-glucose 4,6-dehydratase
MSFRNIYRNKTVFITGHTGFKGSWLTQWLLLLGARVVGYSINIPTEPSLYQSLDLADKIININGDINNYTFLTESLKQYRPDFIFHLAAQSLVQRSYIEPSETFITNSLGTLNILEAVRNVCSRCTVLIVTTDKCYENIENGLPMKENDPLGGHDPYSASKAAAEIITSSYKRSYFTTSNSEIKIFTVRAGNVLGGGDWAQNRLIPDCIRSLMKGESINIRNPDAKRPWQHVLEPLSGYLWLGAYANIMNEFHVFPELSASYNFGPLINSNKTVLELVVEVFKYWPGKYNLVTSNDMLHEAKLLSLDISKAKNELKWSPVWNFESTIINTISWYKNTESITEYTIHQIDQYIQEAKDKSLEWAY